MAGDDDATREISGPTGADLVLAITSAGRVHTRPLPITGEVTIGRSTSCDIHIADAAVSNHHAVLRVAPLAIKDLGSRNGLWLRGERLPPDLFTALSPRDVVEIGGGFLTVRRAHVPARARRIWSHDHLESRLDEECARHARGGPGFTLIRMRAPAGAEVRVVEAALAESMRDEDVLARYAPGDYEMLVIGVDATRGTAALGRITGELSERVGCGRDAIQAGLVHVGVDGSTADELITAVAASFAGGGASALAPKVLPGSQLDLVIREITRVARSELSVLVLGETGVGKELCAEVTHQMSPRHAGPLLRLNCAAIPADLLEAELFGYEKGAFTGATHAKRGLLETASGGTVFIDEIGELSPSTQVKLLRVLEAREVQRIGALAPQSIDVRFVAATHRELEHEIANGRFRQDLYFRIAGYTVYVPPLRERIDEIPPLARHFVARAAEAQDRVPPALGEEVLALLVAYAWPGNVRELRNVIERAVVLAGRGAILPEHLPGDRFGTVKPAARHRGRGSAPTIPRRVGGLPLPALDGMTELVERQLEPIERRTQPLERPSEPVVRPSEPVVRRSEPVVRPGEPLDDALPPAPRAEELRADFRERERAAILLALEQCAGNQTRAAHMLGISRGTLVTKLDAYGLPRPRKR